MSGVVAGGLLGGLAGAGSVLLLGWALAARRVSIEVRVLPYLRDLAPAPTRSPAAVPRSGFGAVLHAVGLAMDRVLGGSESIRRRLERTGVDTSVQQFRIEQALWGLVGFLAATVPAAVLAARDPDRGPALFVLCLVAFALGVLIRENRLTAAAVRRERRILEELPVLAELLALAVAAGESPMAALDRVVARSRGDFAVDLRDLLARARTGTPLTQALDRLGARSGLAPVTRFAHGLAIAIERGTPLADVLHAQAGDVREAARRALIESGGRREVLMMVPLNRSYGYLQLEAARECKQYITAGQRPFSACMAPAKPLL